MNIAKLQGAALALAALGALGLVLWAKKKGVSTVAAGVVGVVGDAAVGTVEGIGQVLGIPRTDADQCQTAIALGDRWNQSKYCPAGTFVATLWRDLTTSEGTITSGQADGAMTGATGGSTDFSFPL